MRELRIEDWGLSDNKEDRKQTAKEGKPQMDLDGHRSERQRGGRSARSLCEWGFPDGSGDLCGKVATHILGPAGLQVCPIHAGVVGSLVCLGLSHWAKGSSRRTGGIARRPRTAREANRHTAAETATNEALGRASCPEKRRTIEMGAA